MFLKGKFSILITCVLLSACGFNKDESSQDKVIKDISTEVDKDAFKSDLLLSVSGYEVDSSARIYVLNECAKIVKTGETTPPHCLNAAEAEANMLFKDIQQNSEINNVEAIDEAGLKQLKSEVITAYTFKKL